MTIKQSLKVINLNTYGELLWTHLNTKVIMHNRALLRACLHGGGGPNLVPRALFPGFGRVRAKAKEKSPGDEVGGTPGRRGNPLKWVTRLSI